MKTGDKKSRRILFKEHDVLRRFEEVADQDGIEKEKLLKEYRELGKKYSELVNQTTKIINISDSNQHKIKYIQEKLEEQNTKINEQNEKLLILNAAKQKYLNIINTELEVAAEYVRSLIPKPITSGRIRTNWKYIPSRQLGGDAFGYHWIDEDYFAIYLFDVCGHGVGPAIHSISALHTLRNQTLPNTNFREPDEVLSSLNKAFQMVEHNDMYFTIWYGVYNIITGELKYSSAGHHQAILFDKDSNIHELMVRNLMIGAEPDFEYTAKSMTFDNECCLYIFSDGVLR